MARYVCMDSNGNKQDLEAENHVEALKRVCNGSKYIEVPTLSEATVVVQGERVAKYFYILPENYDGCITYLCIKNHIEGAIGECKTKEEYFQTFLGANYKKEYEIDIVDKKTLDSLVSQVLGQTTTALDAFKALNDTDDYNLAASIMCFKSHYGDSPYLGFQGYRLVILPNDVFMFAELPLNNFEERVARVRDMICWTGINYGGNDYDDPSTDVSVDKETMTIWGTYHSSRGDDYRDMIKNIKDIQNFQTKY